MILIDQIALTNKVKLKQIKLKELTKGGLYSITQEVIKMEIIREIKKAESNNVSIKIPDTLVNKEIEITVKEAREKKWEKLTFKAMRLNTRGYKFNREEANER